MDRFRQCVPTTRELVKYSLGVDPLAKKILAVKSRNHFRAEFEQIARRTICLAAPGARSTDYTTIPYSRLQRPKWPLDPGAHTEFGL